LIYSYDNSNKFDGFIINSDRTKKESLFFLTLKNLFTIFLTVSEGDMTSASWKRQLISKENVKPIFGEMKLEETVYNFPKEFNLEKVIFETMEGNIYVRSENE